MSRRGAGGGVAKIWWEGKERGQRRKAALMDGLATPGVGWPLVRGKEKENGDGEAGRAWDMQLVRGINRRIGLNNGRTRKNRKLGKGSGNFL